MTTAEPAEGQVPAGDFTPVPDPEVANGVPEERKSNTEVAQEVIAGHWGRGNVRKRKLEAAGYDADAIAKEVSKIFNR